MNILDRTTAPGVTTMTSTPASPNVEAQSLRALGAAWEAVFEQHFDGLCNTQREVHLRTAAVARLPLPREPSASTLLDDLLPVWADALQASHRDARVPLPTGFQTREHGRPHVETHDSPLQPVAMNLASCGARSEACTEAANTAELTAAPSQALIQPSSHEATTENVTVVVTDRAVDIVVRDKSLCDEDALAHAFDTAALLTGNRNSLRRLTLNGHNVYVRRAPSSTTTANPALQHSC
jgi:hypothetical protein